MKLHRQCNQYRDQISTPWASIWSRYGNGLYRLCNCLVLIQMSEVQYSICIYSPMLRNPMSDIQYVSIRSPKSVLVQRTFRPWTLDWGYTCFESPHWVQVWSVVTKTSSRGKGCFQIVYICLCRQGGRERFLNCVCLWFHSNAQIVMLF